jgi:3-hydroxymyristoyl/3-hydroxydecanoyl-(acyl carrier protein) dehydratase
MNKKVVYNLDDITAILPHRPPFLFVDTVTKFDLRKSIETERYLREDEPHFQGHFPQNPIMPGVLITDALAQTSGLLWGFSEQIEEERKNAEKNIPEIFFLAAASMKFKSPAYPGDTLRMTSSFDENYGTLYIFSVEANVKYKVVAKGTLTLAVIKKGAQ